MFALTVIADWRFAHDHGAWGRLRDGRTWDGVLRGPHVHRFKTHATLVTMHLFLTALSDSSVFNPPCLRPNTENRSAQVRSSLGLVYNEFLLMGARLAPPMDELFAATAGEGSTWRKFFENPTTAQYDHHVLAMSTDLAMAQLFASSRRAAVRAALPPAALRTTTAAFAMVNV